MRTGAGTSPLRLKRTLRLGKIDLDTFKGIRGVRFAKPFRYKRELRVVQPVDVLARLQCNALIYLLDHLAAREDALDVSFHLGVVSSNEDMPRRYGNDDLRILLLQPIRHYDWSISIQ